MNENRANRPIRSFVLRTGRMTPAQRRAMTELWPRFGIDLTTDPLNLQSLFDSEAPITLEIGIGNGDCLAAMAATAPDTNFLGIEVHEPGIGHCLLRIAEENLQNVRLIHRDAIEVLKSSIPDNSSLSFAQRQMQKMGYVPGGGLGRHGQGITAPVDATGQSTTRGGIGSQAQMEAAIHLSAEQQRAVYIALEEGRNLFLTGCAGTGKSLVARRITKLLRERYAACTTPDSFWPHVCIVYCVSFCSLQ